jgi:hypothetical protein
MRNQETHTGGYCTTSSGGMGNRNLILVCSEHFTYAPAA